MFSKLPKETILGINGALIAVEADVNNDLSQSEVAGLQATAVKEARERVKLVPLFCHLAGYCCVRQLFMTLIVINYGTDKCKYVW